MKSKSAIFATVSIVTLSLCHFVTFAAFAADKDCATRKTTPEGPQTLQQIIELGLCRNPQTSAAYLASESARLSKNGAYAPYLPSVDASASVSDQYVNKQWQGKNYSASLSATWLIFDFGKRLENLNQMAALWRASGFDYSNTVQNYVYQVIASYYGLLTADAQVKSSAGLVAVSQSAKDTASKKFAAGAAAKADVLQAETNLASRQLDLQRAQNNREVAKGQLLYLLSFAQSQELKISDMPAQFGGATEMKTIDELIAKAKKTRPDLLSAQESTNAAWHRRNTAFLSNLPSISANGSLAYNPERTFDQFGNPNDKLGGSIGVRASMPIFAGFANVYNVRAQQVNYERAQEQERDKENSVELDIWTAYQNYQTARQVLGQTDALLKSATESEKVTGGMYKVGRATMLDWQTQQANLADAQRQNISARYDLYVKRAALAQAVGDLKEELDSGNNDTMTE